MNTRFVPLVALGAICFGCATPPEQPLPGAAAAPAKTATTSPSYSRSRATLTGSRLPPLDGEDPGTSSVSGVTGDDYRHDTAATMMPKKGEGGMGGRGGGL